MKIMERIYKSVNGVIEKTRYYVGDRAKARGKRKKGNTNFRKQEQNFNSAVRRLARILNCNYSHDGGLLIGLDFDEKGLRKLMDKVVSQMVRPAAAHGQTGSSAPTGAGEVGVPLAGSTGASKESVQGAMEQAASRVPTRGEILRCAQNDMVSGADVSDEMDLLREAAEKEGKLYWRRLKRKLGKDIKVVLVTSDMDGDTGEIARVHCHIVLQAEKDVSWDMLRELWPNGTVDIKQLKQQADYSKLAAYLMRQVRHQPDKKKYAASRGMVMPQTEEREIAFMSEIKTPPGAQVFERRYADDESSQYVRYLPKKKGKKIGGHKLTAGGGDDGAV